MNIFKSLIGKVWQDPNAAEVVKISSGQLYLVRPGNIRSYNDAMATIRRAPSIEHHFQLVITRVYEEGDQELLEDEDETDEERVFLVAEDLEFRTGTTDGDPTFVWRDLEGDVDEFYEYVAPETNEPTKAFFEICMYRAMYERKYKASAENIPDSGFEEFIWQPTSSKPAHPKRTASKDIKAETKPKADKRASSFSASVDTIVSHEAELYFWNADTEEFVHQGVVIAEIVQKKGVFEFFISAKVDDGPLLAHQITASMNQRFSGKMSSITWNNVAETGTTSWLFRFTSEAAYREFFEAFGRCLWEEVNQAPWEKVKVDEQNYYISSIQDEDVIMRDVEDEEEDEDEVEGALNTESDEEDDDYEQDPEDLPPALAKGERNSQLTVGYKGDRSYVVRGNNIGVFSQADGEEVKYFATISKLATPKGKEFRPKQVMLHDQDSKMILMNPSDPNSLYSMDLERGKIVEEWKVHDDITVDHIAPQTKFAQTTHEQTLVGASHNALFRIDPRVSGNKMVESQYKQYAGKNKFSAVTTTKKGQLAVASEKGDIRLFDSIGKNAKTALPPLGDPILGIDVTADGRYIVATTKTYLLLIDTLIGEGRYQGSLGFDRSFPASAKPMPRRLQLRAEHVAYMDHDVSFSPARFNQGEDQEENAIVTSTGQFVIAWDFAKVKKGHLDRYEIKKYEDHVVQDNFKFGDDKQIIVALQNNVLAVNKKQLKKPTRHSLGAPNLASRSSIVNSPY
ncbi:VID27 cytoplasmic protein-domain-containing protein [Mycena floridula]|nr:VID27 cytoplasmic protein-domain-containing protein [Mycena floridula]